MSSPDNALQAAIYARLTGYAPLTSALGGSKIFDHVPQGTSAPYVVIGGDTLLEWDNKSRDGFDATITLHAWDFEKAGRKSVKSILGHVYDALHRQQAAVTVAGFSVTDLRFEFQETFPESAEGDADGYYHGVARYRAKITA